MHQKVMSNLLLIYAAVPRKAPVKSDFMELELGRNFAKDAHELDIFGTIGDFKEKIPVLHGERDGTVPNQNLSVHFKNKIYSDPPFKNHKIKADHYKRSKINKCPGILNALQAYRRYISDLHARPQLCLPLGSLQPERSANHNHQGYSSRHKVSAAALR